MLAIGIIFTTLLALTNAHGGIYLYNMDQKYYQGNQDVLTEESIQFSWRMDPVYDVTSSNISCKWPGLPAQKSVSAEVNAGDTITAWWQYLDNTTQHDFVPWAHGHGPVLAYMAACNGDCKDLDVTKKVWFKVAQVGLEPEAKDMQDNWWQLRLIQGEGFQFQVPSGLKPGNYLVRHEIIMLASKPAQFYPNCGMVTVGGQGTEEPADDYLVSFPGAYSPEDPGIAIADWMIAIQPMEPQFNTTDYKFPGPKVWTGNTV